MIPTVLSEMETMRRVAETGCNLARAGRCELKLCQARSALAQLPHPELAKRLRQILKSQDERTLVCLPRVFEGFPDANKEHYYREFTEPEVVRDLFTDQKQYGSTFVSRRDGWIGDMDEASYWTLVRDIWQYRDVLLTAGSDKGRRAKDGFLENAASVTVHKAPERNAWSDYHNLRSACVSWAAGHGRNPLIYLALGATATVLAYDLALLDVQALDLGHMDQSWRNADLKSPEFKKEVA